MTFELDQFIGIFGRSAAMKLLGPLIAERRETLESGWAADFPLPENIPGKVWPSKSKITICWRTPGHQEFCEEAMARAKLKGL